MTLTRLCGAALIIAAISGCNCRPTTFPPLDGGEDDGGFDGGDVDSGMPVEPTDAGEVDAGPPPELKLTRLLPPRGPSAGGATVLLQGQGFIRNFSTTGSEAKRLTTIKFGSNPVIDYQIIDDKTLELRAPPGMVGPTTVTMTNPLGTFRCNSCFTYFDELQVSSFSPTSGPLRGGNEVTINGQGFTEDVEVLFGSQSSPSVTVASASQLKVIAPAGVAADLVDLVVFNKNGVGSQRRAYRYVNDTRVLGLAPGSGPLAGGNQVTLSGQGFTGATAVSFGSGSGTAVNVVSDSQLTVTAPARAQAGVVDVTVTTAADQATLKNGYFYDDGTGGFALFSVVPSVAAPGQSIKIFGRALSGASPTVTIGGRPASVSAFDASSITVVVPSRSGAPRRADVVVTEGASNATLAQGFTWRLSVSSVTPSKGPAAGGTSVALAGADLPPDAEVFVGALKSPTVNVMSETALTVVTPKGSGGAANPVRVREASNPLNEAVLPSAFTFEQPIAIGSVQPARGAVAGGTLVTVLGAGFGDSTVVSFGPNKAKDVKIVDTHTLTCRTPKGDVGTVDVGIARLGQTDSLPGGFSYFDPRSISGGLSGGPLVGTLNVTVLSSDPNTYGAPIPMATVMLGLDPATPFQGLTDTRGQITFSDPSLVKAQTVTVYKTNFQSTTVTSVNAENLTVFMSPTGGGDGSPSNGAPPPGVPASTISGRVTGFKAPRALVQGETLEARVFVAQTSLYAGPPFAGLSNHNQEKWQVVAEGGEYLVFTGAGLRATYAVLGIANRGQNTFVPYLMGVKRGITTSPDVPATNQHIVLDMHLDVTVPITIDSPLTFSGSPGLNSVYAWLDLGAEGFIPNPNNWSTGTVASSSVSSTSATLSFGNFPHLDGSNFIFLNESAGAQSYPVSYYFRRQPGDLSTGVSIGPMLPAPEIVQPSMTVPFTGTISWNIAPTPVPNIHDVQVLKPTLFGNLNVWEVVLPGSENQVVLPQPAVLQLQQEQAGQQLFIAIFSSRSPKFSYNQWTYDTLSGVSWSSFTISISEPFTP